jgi:hypothetical protein
MRGIFTYCDIPRQCINKYDVLEIVCSFFSYVDLRSFIPLDLQRRVVTRFFRVSRKSKGTSPKGSEKETRLVLTRYCSNKRFFAILFVIFYSCNHKCLCSQNTSTTSVTTIFIELQKLC